MFRPLPVVIAILAALVAAALVFRFAGGAYLRDWAEATLNENVEGYQIALPELRVDVLGLGLELLGTTVRQQDNPEPPVARIEGLGLKVSWSALLHGELMAVLELDAPRVHIDRRQVVEEAADEKGIEERGWQDALFAIYPLEIDRFTIRDGAITYIAPGEEQPLEIDDISLTATDIRNVRSAERTYPSRFDLEARLLKEGSIDVDGRADFLASPYAAMDVDFDIREVPMAALDSLTRELDIHLNGGVMAANGHVEYGPKKKEVYVQRVRIDGLGIGYVDGATDTDARRLRAEVAEEAAQTLSEEEATRVYIDLVELRGSELAYERPDRDYRVFVSSTDVTLRDIVNREPEKRSSLRTTGSFMGAGPLSLEGSYRAGETTPDFDIDLRIEETPLTALNDVLRAHGDFDVSDGTFAFYSELEANDGELRGYVKPLLHDMDVYDRAEDRHRSALGEVYEGFVGAVANLFENRSDEVAAKVDVSGRIDNPGVSTWQAVISVVSNAFISAVSRGFERDPTAAEEEG